MGLHQTKKLLHRIEIINRMKKQPTEWKKLFANYISKKEVISKIYKELKQLNNKSNNLILKMERGSEKTFFQRKYADSQEADEKMLDTREAQINITMRYQLTLVRMVIFKRKRNNKCWWGCGAKGTLVHYWWECKLVKPLWKTAWRWLKTLKIELPYNPVIPLLGIYLKKTNTLIQKDICTSTKAKIWKQPKNPSTDDWIKMWYVYLYTGILLSQ